ncbi:MAG TPA: NAD(P)-dependent oxidoreductase [Abditibacteriaceae bacterium]|jgi:nucleoside-diphosphate-sugar epimerase
MAQSFTATGTGALAELNDAVRRRVLVTGAAGRIGSYFAENSQGKYDLRLMIQGSEDAENIEKIKPLGEVVTASLDELERLKEICAGIDTVVHMAGDPSPSATWQDLLDANIIGTYNIFVAAKAAGCRRVIHASSIHAVSGYPADVQVKTSEPVNPGDLYGVSKCFGEALGRYVAEKEGLSVITLRIGAFQPIESAEKESSVSMLDAFVSHRDLNQLINRCIDVENVKFAILHGLSNNRFKRLDISDARELVGYDPQDDLTELNPKLKELNLSQTVQSHGMIVDSGEQHSGLREDL